jgi:hypothetical protein
MVTIVAYIIAALLLVTPVTQEVGFCAAGTQITTIKACFDGALAPDYTQEDVELIAKTLYGECRGEPDAGRLAAAQCIIDRWASDKRKEETIEEVVTARGQFGGYRPDNPVLGELCEVAVRALRGERAFPAYEVLYFQRKDTKQRYGAVRIGRIGGHTFHGYKRDIS